MTPCRIRKPWHFGQYLISSAASLNSKVSRQCGLLHSLCSISYSECTWQFFDDQILPERDEEKWLWPHPTLGLNCWEGGTSHTCSVCASVCMQVCVCKCVYASVCVQVCVQVCPCIQVCVCMQLCACKWSNCNSWTVWTLNWTMDWDLYQVLDRCRFNTANLPILASETVVYKCLRLWPRQNICIQ